MDKTIYVVLRIRDGIILLCTKSLDKAAEAMAPGTVCGKGNDSAEAMADAMGQIERLKKNSTVFARY